MIIYKYTFKLKLDLSYTSVKQRTLVEQRYFKITCLNDKYITHVQITRFKLQGLD